MKFAREEGLTLIELLVVIALVGIVAAISLPILLNTVEKANAKATTASDSNVVEFKSVWETAGYLTAQDGDNLVAYEDINANGAYERGVDDVHASIFAIPSLSEAGYSTFIGQHVGEVKVKFQQVGTEIVAFYDENGTVGYQAGVDTESGRMTGKIADANFTKAFTAFWEARGGGVETASAQGFSIRLVGWADFMSGAEALI